ncbi:glycosyltransferase [Muribacter muris]|uniref:Glycosyltransferase n=1 Tax=Muribacter muris TaxID=67855 RepID=A0A4Y9K2T0_9PAST|nr:glycosyltransferase [Muribacter muris]MBF0784789.1 glycosyltransferase [Muribacter muris]MBF0826652.1 glycosyltransferase [Muribacter muris]TFV11025.1 glycosyltransferase [Muribacter muris]
MRILFLITGLGMGGAERQVCDLADSLSSLGHSIQIISLSSKLDTGVLPNRKEIELFYLNMNKNPISFIITYLKLRNLIQKFQPSVVHSHMFHANIMARLLKLTQTFPKLICTAHSKNEGGKLRMLAYRITNRLADLNTNVSQDAVDEFIKKKAVNPNQMIAISNGINLNIFYKNEIFKAEVKKELEFDDSVYIFLAIGRLTDAKDYPNLLKAFSIVKHQKENVFLLIAGIGELEESLKDLAKTLNLSHNVKFLGLRRDIPKLMNVADTYVMSSYYEGLPLVLGEAMATENIVVSTDCGGPKEIIGNNGFLASIHDSQKLAEKMLETMALSQEQREILGKNAREHIKKNYSLDAITKKWLELYQV